MNPWAIAAACSIRGLTPAETDKVQAALVAQTANVPTTLTAGQAQRVLELAIDVVLKKSRGFAVYEPEDKAR